MVSAGRFPPAASNSRGIRPWGWEMPREMKKGERGRIEAAKDRRRKLPGRGKGMVPLDENLFTSLAVPQPKGYGEIRWRVSRGVGGVHPAPGANAA